MDFLFCRFFVIEDHVLQTASGLVTRSYRDELWELALHHSTKTMNSHFVLIIFLKLLIADFMMRNFSGQLSGRGNDA